jgi:MFS family permease
MSTSQSVSAVPADTTTFTPEERRSALSLASIFALRMLGLFLVLPVFAIEAARYPGGQDAAMVGLTMGIYGLTQGVLQIPFGLASDRFGRKRVIILGLLVFAAGSFWAAAASTLPMLLLGRALQGAGAISAAVTALLADQNRDSVRTKAMAIVGGSIALMFALSLVIAPPLARAIGLSGLFALTGALALAGVWVVWRVAPPEPTEHKAVHQRGLRGGLAEVLRHPGLLRLDVGVFVLHAVQLAMWVAVPGLLMRAGLAQSEHWWVYLPAVLASFVVMGSTLFPLEKRGHLRAVFLAAIALIGLVQLGFWATVQQAPAPSAPSMAVLAVLLFLFFCGFNVLEASQPSLASRIAPPHARGAALGVYNTLQSLGFFVGGAVGGWLLKSGGEFSLFAVCGTAMLLWLVVAWGMQVPPTAARAQVEAAR